MVDSQRPSSEADLVSGYPSPGPPPNQRTRSALGSSPNRMPNLGSGKAQLPSGATDIVSRSRVPSEVQRYTVASPISRAAGATRVRTVNASSLNSTPSRRCRIRCRPNVRQSSPNRVSVCQDAPSSLSVGARHTSRRRPVTSTAPIVLNSRCGRRRWPGRG